MGNCLFCNIANHSIPADIVYEDDEIIAFNDIAPQAPTHILVIPKEHIESSNYFDTSNQALIGKLMATASIIAKEQDLAEVEPEAVVLAQGEELSLGAAVDLAALDRQGLDAEEVQVAGAGGLGGIGVAAAHRAHVHPSGHQGPLVEGQAAAQPVLVQAHRTR